MGFWQKVDEELDYSGMTRKELAAAAQFPDSYIPKGIARGSVPSADLAVRIAHALGVSVEYLLDLPEADGAEDAAEAGRQRALYRKYQAVIGVLESLPEEKRAAAVRIVEQCGVLGG